MPERLVDVLKHDQALLHTFPVEVGSDAEEVEEIACAKAHQAAAYAGLVPETEHHDLTTRIHVGRSGSIVPPGDRLRPWDETRPHLEQCVREHAFHLWEEAGRPEGHADEFWSLAYDQHVRERAYRLWKYEGCPEGRSEEFWHKTVAFDQA